MTTTTNTIATQQQTGASALAPLSVVTTNGYYVELLGDLADDPATFQAAGEAIRANAHLFGKFESIGPDWLIHGPFTIWSHDGSLSIKKRPDYVRPAVARL